MEKYVAETGRILTEALVQALGKKQDDDAAHGEIDTAHPEYLGSQDTFYVGTIKGMGRIYQQTFVYTYSKWAATKPYTTKTPITMADLLNDIEHTKMKANHPQTNGICERFHKTILQEFYQVTFRRKIYQSIEELQHDLDEWMVYYNNARTYQGKMCCGRPQCKL